MSKKRSLARRLLIVAGILLGLFVLSLYPGYRLAKYAFNSYFDRWGDKLVGLEKRGLLSKQFGAAWQDILTTDAMRDRARRLLDEQDTARQQSAVAVVDGVPVRDYPSLSIIRRLNEIHHYSNCIEIDDRKDRPIAVIRTDHTRGSYEEFPRVLVTALVAAEDGSFMTNKLGFSFDSYVRATIKALSQAATTFSKPAPKGTSTITQQVAKLFISDVDEGGVRHVNRSIDRKMREMRLASALRKMYSPREILEVYLNHCVTSDYGLIGYKDIARGLFGRRLDELTDAQCIYLARMVKWGRHVNAKIVNQCRLDMPRMGAALGWDRNKQRAVLREIDGLTFLKPKRVQTDFGPLVDMANEFWLRALRTSGASEQQLADMDIIDPNSLLRKKGNLTLRLTVDLPLQRFLQSMVDARGFGRDTVILTDVRAGSSGEDVGPRRPPRDTLRRISLIDGPREFSEPGSEFKTVLQKGDTLVTNIRYQKTGPSMYRRGCFYYVRRAARVDGQYFAYVIMDARTGSLLAYYSRDKIGSRLACLLENRTPNGSSTAKPIVNALNFDLGTFPPYEKWSDSAGVTDEVPWKRTLVFEHGKQVGVTFANSAVRGRGYTVNNHGSVFEGCQYIFDLLSTSNNILGVESVYRLNRTLFTFMGGIAKDALPLVQFFHRIDALDRVKNTLGLKTVTGVRVYKELARIVGVDIDSIESFGRRVPVSDSMYSIALGTLELTLYEQLHLFNVLYNNDLIERPADHPSLVISAALLGSDTLAIGDTVRRFHPFADINNLRPTYLGMHKRLVSNRADGLEEYDLPWIDTTQSTGDTTFSPDRFSISEPVVNFAKSGTTDDVKRPFNVDVTSAKRTNFGIWNAVLRVDLARLAGDAAPDMRDITIACIGECNARYTGERDGKTLHKYISRGLLERAGTKSPNGFFTQYEAYLRRVTPLSMRNCGAAPAAPAGEAPRYREGGD